MTDHDARRRLHHEVNDELERAIAKFPPRRRILREVSDELGRAIEKFPPMRSSHEGYAIILEELDELWAEIKANKADGSADRMNVEARQVAAMAIRFILDSQGGWPTNDRDQG